MRFTKVAILGLSALVLGSLGNHSTSHAREPREIYAPIFAQYKSITDARKKLRRKEKKGEAMSGDEYFAMAVACTYEEPESASRILTALSRSRCKENVSDYYLEAGRRGTAEGFLAAARLEASAHDAYGFAQLAYQFSGDDIDLRNSALELLSDLQTRVANPALANQQAMQISQQLVAAGSYSAFREPAEGQALAGVLPRLDWLNFSNPAKCGWSEAAIEVMEGAWRFDGRRARPMVPATVRVPGQQSPVTGRVVRPDRQAPNYAVLNVDFQGRWNGLKVLGLTDAVLEESDGVFGKGIRFSDPVATVAARLREAGFAVSVDGSDRVQADHSESVRYADENGRIQTQVLIDGTLTSIERRDGETVFLCNEVYGWSG